MKIQTKRFIVNGIGGILLFIMIGIVGGMDGNTINFNLGIILCLVCILCASFCFHKGKKVRK
jgi:drug/metabolite transporter (DMT)-like permease